MKMTRRFAVLLLACAMILSTLVGVLPGSVRADQGFSNVGGWLESIYAEIPGITDADVLGVSYAGPVSGELTGEDLAFLVRDSENGVRIDIPGLSAGSYTLTVTTVHGTLVQEGISVLAHDRSGYAHFNYTQGVGAYKDDGTLKDNAIVLYVTDENKNTVTVTSSDGTTVSGIGNILNTGGKDVGNGKSSKGGLANTNQDILKKLAADGTPLVVRIVGNVTAPEGLTAWGAIDYGGNEDDNGSMARMAACRDITVEGIGADAVVNGWGFSVICQTGNDAAGLGESFEFRNITFKNVPEDCIGMEGTRSGSTLSDPIERCWVHNCSFYGPTNIKDASDDQDKDGGDGACDFKRGQYMTMSYCYYESYHKTNLVGGSDSDPQFNITWHHNYWKDCESRGPLGRQANMHIYNNIYENQTSYVMSVRANLYVFSEYNLFLNSKNPVQVKQGAVKSYHDSFTGSSGDNQSTQVTDRATTVSSGNKYANFDTNASLSYVPSGNYQLDESIEQMKRMIYAYGGSMKANVVSPENANISEIPVSAYPTAAVALPYDQTLNKSYVTSTSGTFDNVVFRVAKTANDCVTVGGTGAGIVFYVDTAVNVTMTALSGSYAPQLCNAAGEALLTGTGTVCDLPAGYYYINSNAYDNSSDKYKEAKISALTITAFDPNAPTEPIPDAPTAGPETPTDPTDPSVPSEPGQTDTPTVIPEGSYVHNFTESGKESSFYTINGNLSNSKGTVYFNGLTLTQCLKIESSTSISFTAPEAGQLVLVLGTEVDNAVGQKIKVDGENFVVGEDGTVTVSLAAGAHTVTKNKYMHMFYLAYIPESANHTHSWGQWVETVAPNATQDGVNTRICTGCGETETEVVDNNIFTDVPEDRFTNGILWAYYNGITTGTGDGTTFSPENSCTRKQIVTFLWRAAGEPEPKSMENPFVDVKADRFEKAILWAYYEGITTGTGDGSTFSPENTCTRKQIVTFLWRYHDEPAPESMEIPFTDVKDDRFAPAILWAAEQGITTGTGDGSTFSPESPCTRKQIVTFLYRDLAQ